MLEKANINKLNYILRRFGISLHLFLRGAFYLNHSAECHPVGGGFSVRVHLQVGGHLNVRSHVLSARLKVYTS